MTFKLINHLLSVVLPRISPQSILKQVLGPWIIISEIPKFFPNFSQSFKGVVDRGVLFPSRLVFINCLFTLFLTK